MPESVIPMPEDFKVYNGGTMCDTLSGPCSCGAWHSRKEWARKADPNDNPMHFSAKEQEVFALLAAYEEDDHAQS